MRVLIADADPAFVKTARLALQDEGLTVETASDAAEVLERAVALPYDCAVLDLALPGGRGGELISRMVRNRVDVPLLALTTDSQPEARIDALRRGADDCLVKPVVVPELAARVHALARRAARKKGDCLEVEDLVLHVARKKAFRAGNALHLTEREFLALERLVRAHGEPVSAAELLRIVWHEEGEPQPNFIAVLMMRLRKKVDDGFARKLVRTIRGAGYVVAPAED